MGKKINSYLHFHYNMKIHFHLHKCNPKCRIFITVHYGHKNVLALSDKLKFREIMVDLVQNLNS